MTDTQRAAFEAAMEKHGRMRPFLRWPGDGSYTDDRIEWAWRGYQAAQAADAGREAVAVVGPTYQLLYADVGSIASIVKKHGLKVGDTLYKRPAAHSEPVAWQVRRADGRIDGVPIQWESCTKELYAATLATGRYAGYENGPQCEVRALTLDGAAINAELVEALEETQGLLVAMMHETRSREEIGKQLDENRAALSHAKEQKS